MLAVKYLIYIQNFERFTMMSQLTSGYFGKKKISDRIISTMEWLSNETRENMNE